MTQPQVELLFHPTDLNPADLGRAGQFLGSPSQAIEAGLGALRLMMVDRMKAEIAHTTGNVSVDTLVRAADLAWSAAFWKFRKVSAPVMADAYVRAYRTADAGDVPMSVIYDLADRHADRIGDYFHQSSKQAMLEGFNSYVNRRIGTRAAADRVLDAYGLTPRQMTGYTAATDSLEGKVNTRERRSLKAKILDYVARSFRSRARKFAAQEAHNIDMQAQQFAWMWLVEKGRLNAAAEKVWITAKDERVCKICGPLHGQRVGVNEQFHTDKGNFWTPGIHPNCRCTVRLIENTFTVSKTESGGYFHWRENEHPRASSGEFARKPKRVTTLERTSEVDQKWLRQMQALAHADQNQAAVEATPALTGSDTLHGTALRSSGTLHGTLTPVQAPAPLQAGVDIPKLTSAPALTGAAPLVGNLLTGQMLTSSVEPITVESLQATNPALTLDHLVASSVAYDRLTKPVSELRTTSTVRTRDVVDIPGDSPEEKIVYLYDPDQQKGIGPDEPETRFTVEDDWMKGQEGRAAVYASMQKDINRQIVGVLRDIEKEADSGQRLVRSSTGGNAIIIRTPTRFTDPKTGLTGGMEFVVSDSDLERMITETAYNERDENGNLVSDPLPRVAVKPVLGSEAETRGIGDLPTETVMGILGITPELFQKTIYEAARAHHEGAEPTDNKTRYGLEAWINTGDFEVVRDEVMGPFRRVFVEPIAEVTEHKAD